MVMVIGIGIGGTVIATALAACPCLCLISLCGLGRVGCWGEVIFLAFLDFYGLLCAFLGASLGARVRLVSLCLCFWVLAFLFDLGLKFNNSNVQYSNTNPQPK